MSKKKKNSNNFEFNKALKNDTLFPFVKYLPVDRYIVRPAASLFAKILFKTPITPNQVTIFSFYLGILSGVLYCFGEPRYFIIAGIILQFSLIFDCVDGMLARSKDMCTRFGAYLDIFLDRIVDFFFVSGIVIGHYVYSGNMKLLITGIFATALLFLEISLDYITRDYKQREKSGEGAAVKSLFFVIAFVFTLLNRLDIFIIALLIAMIIIISLRVLTFPGLEHKK
ncbi:CDP-alcohol phosphatidyltransferase family protein [Acidobacteriota bacterium]